MVILAFFLHILNVYTQTNIRLEKAKISSMFGEKNEIGENKIRETICRSFDILKKLYQISVLCINSL